MHYLTALLVLYGSLEPSGLRAQLRVLNEDALRSLKVGEEAAARILDDPRMVDVNLPSRIAELRESVGLTRTSLKVYLHSYPDVCVGFFADRVKTSKSVVMRVIQISEKDYEESIRRIPSQTNNKAGVLFRGSFPFIVASLRDHAGMTIEDLSFLFKKYPTIFTLDYRTVAARLVFFRATLGYSQEQLRLLLLRNCRSALCGQARALALKSYFANELDVSSAEFCELTVAHPRLFGVSLSKTLRPKVEHLADSASWGIPRPRLSELVKRAPSVLTTPAATTRQLWHFLHVDLGLEQKEAQEVVRKYPNLLRVNAQALDVKLRSLTLAQLELLAEDRGLLGEERGGGGGEGEQQAAFARAAEQLYASVASALLQSAPLALTCSLERIEGRMRALGAARGLEAASLCPSSTLSLQKQSKHGIAGAKGGGVALAALLGGRLELVEALARAWAKDQSFAVAPATITISDARFEALLEKRRREPSP